MSEDKIVSGLRPTDEVGDNPKDKYGLAKVPFSVIPASSLVFMAQAMKIGAKKYGIHNWRVAKVQGRIYLEAAFRHLLALMDGEDFDPVTGIHHGGFIMATTGIYLDAMVNNGLIDNRVLPGRAGELISVFNDAPNYENNSSDLRQILKAILSLPPETIHRLGGNDANSLAASAPDCRNEQHPNRAERSTRSPGRTRVGKRRTKRQRKRN